MSRITRKVTVEVGKKVTEGTNVSSSVVQPSSSSSSNRRSVFERLGPGAVERSKSRDTYTPDKCRNWLRDGRCPYGSNCKFLHGPYTEPKVRSKSVRSIIHGGSKDSGDYDDDDDPKEISKLKRRYKSEEDISDLSIKKSVKSKKKRKEDVDDGGNEDGKVKRKHKSRKRVNSPKAQSRASNDDDEDYDRSKNNPDWEESGELDFERQLELERRRQDLQRQLALMDEEDAAASTSEPEWKGKEKEEDQRKIPIIHSKLHPDPSSSTPEIEGSLQVVKKKKKKKLDGEGKKVKAKKDASPKKKEEPKRKVSDPSAVDDSGAKKHETPVKKNKAIDKYPASSEDEELSDHLPRKKTQAPELQDNFQPFPDERKRSDDGQASNKRGEAKSVKERRRGDVTPGDNVHVDDHRPRRARESAQEYYPLTDEQDEESRKARVKSSRERPISSKHTDEGHQDDRARRREEDSRGPRTPSPHSRGDDRGYYDEHHEEFRRKRPLRGSSQTPPRESAREEPIQRIESRAGPKTPSDEEGRFSPRPIQDNRGGRYGERERGPPQRRDPRDRVPVQGDHRYPDRSRPNVDPDYERRRPREDDFRSRRPPDNVRNREDESTKHRGRDDNFPRSNRDEDRHRVEREDDRGKYRDGRPDDYPGRSRPREDDFSRSRNRDDPHDDGRGRPPQRDVRRRHDDPEGRERDDRDRLRTDYDSRGRYGAPIDGDHYRRPSPPHGPPRGRTPPHRYEDRGRTDDSFRSGPGGRDSSSRGRAVGRGRSSYTPPFENRGKPVDNRRRSPPPPGPPRSSYQDRDRGPPRGRDAPVGRGRGYLDKGRPQNDRYRDSNVPWDRRSVRDYTMRDSAVRDPNICDRRPRDSPPPPPPLYRDERPWDEKEHRERSGIYPPQDRRDLFDLDRDNKERIGSRDRHSLDRGPPPEWEFGADDPNQVNSLRKRTHPPSGRSASPVEVKKAREQSPISLAEVPGAEIPESVETEKPKKITGVFKDGKKIKKKKKEGKVAKAAASGEVLAVGATATGELKVIKGEKKVKKEKKLKEKGGKKKKKAVIAPPVETELPVADEAEVPDVIIESEETLAQIEKTNEIKLGKKRKQAQETTESEPPTKVEADKPKKKKKKKHQPEVLVQPWNDLEGDDDQQDDASKAVEKPVEEIHAVKSQDDVFSDWSDDGSPVGDDSWLDEDAAQSFVDAAVQPDKEPSVDKAPAFDDVYDPISDDEFDAMYTHSDEEELAANDQDTIKALGVEDVDWSSLGIHHDENKDKEPISHLERFKPSYVFSRIGISSVLAGQRLTQLVLDTCAKDSVNKEELSISDEGLKSIGAFVASSSAKKRERNSLLGNLGSCRRALCARRDLAMRKQLGKSSKFGKLSLFAASPTTPGDNELFQMSVALYRKESANKDSVRIIQSKVGSILLSQA